MTSIPAEYAVVEYNITEGEVIGPDILDPHITSDTPTEIRTEYTKDTELVAEKYYSDNGYEVIRLDPSSNIRSAVKDTQVLSNLQDDIETKLRQNTDYTGFASSSTWPIERKGIPDLLIYDVDESEEIEYWFVEVKSKSGQLQMSQLDWITRFDFLPTKVSYFEFQGTD